MLSLQQLSLSYAPAAALTTTRTARAVPQMANTAEDLETLAKELNPVVGYWDPLGIGKIAKSIDADEQATIGWWRHAEIKHGRVAMAAFVGFCVQSNGIVIPGQLTTSGITYADIAAAGGPGDQWDALPTWAKVQIICAVGFLEVIGELSPVIEANGEKHYVKGGKPGYYPPFSGFFNEQYWPHPLPLNLYDPFNFMKNASPEKKAKGLRAEINNGRLAMIGTPGRLSPSQPHPSPQPPAPIPIPTPTPTPTLRPKPNSTPSVQLPLRLTRYLRFRLRIQDPRLGARPRDHRHQVVRRRVHGTLRRRRRVAPLRRRHAEHGTQVPLLSRRLVWQAAAGPSGESCRG